MDQLPPNQSLQVRNLGQLIANLGPQSPLAAQSKADPKALAAGIKPSFAVLTFKGKTFGIRHRGVTHQLLARDQNGTILGAIPTIDVIILKSATAISKTFYIDAYQEGDYRPPDCFSTNGLKPDPASPKLQSETCKGCRWDAFGSRTITSTDGTPRKGKACSDNKRLAVVPAHDIKNEAFGGPMLLRLPPSTFGGLSELETQLQMQGYAYFAVVMRVSFDHTVAYPKLVFTPVSVLNDYQMQEVLNLQSSDLVERILNEEAIEVSADPNQTTAEMGTAQPVSNVVPLARQPQASAAPGAPVAGTGQINPPQVQPAQTQAFQPTPPPASAPVQGVVASGFSAVPTPAPTPPTEADRQFGQPHHGHPPEAVETAEQRIARLEAELAAARGPKRQTRKRSQPVTPAGNGQPEGLVVQPPSSALPGDQPIPFPQPQGASSETSEGDEDTPADLDSKIDALLEPPGNDAA